LAFRYKEGETVVDYRIRSGDTMSGIAAKFGVSLSALEAANTQIANPALIFPNELVHIPGAAPQVGHLTPVVPAIVTYTVQGGDTMNSIAAAHNMTLAALEAANPHVTNPNVIKVGEILNIIGGGSDHPASMSSAGAIPINAVNYGMFTGNGNVASWITQACQIMGQPTAFWMKGYVVLCRRESSGSPNAINHHDKNAKGPLQADGFPLHCSRGIAQCIPDTFASNHIPHTSQAIYDPVANIAASMHYVRNRYGVSADGHDLAARVQQADPNRSPLGY
jgi:LysM repeat protein